MIKNLHVLEPLENELNVLIQGKQKHLCFLKQDVSFYVLKNNLKIVLLNINFKLEASIENDGFSIKTPFVLVKEISRNVILGTPFMNMITPYKVYPDYISCSSGKRKLIFYFEEKPKIKNIHVLEPLENELNVLIQGKQKHLCFLKQDVSFYVLKNNLKIVLLNIIF